MAARDWIWVFLLGGIWGSSFLFNAVLIRELGPLWVSAGRVAVGAVGVWLFVALRSKPLPSGWGQYAHFVVFGVVSYAIPFALFPLAQQSLASGVAAILNATTPIMTVAVSQIWIGGEKATANKVAGVLAGLVGVTTLSSPMLGSGEPSALWAIGACLLATVCYAVSLNYARSFIRADPTVTAAGALTGASLAAAPAAFLFEGAPHLASAEGWTALLGIGLLATAFAMQLFFRILPRIGATNASVVTIIAPVSAAILGALFLGEKLSLAHFAGFAFIAVGLALINGKWFRLRRREA